MSMPPIVSPQEWDAAREALLVKEKELTRARDALAAERRRMPRMAVEKDYRFEGPDGPVSLLELFEGRRQLILYRFFYEPGVAGWPESGCPGCSFMADQVANLAHLNARDTTFANVSRAPQPDIERWKARMGWEMPWYTITDDFDADFGVDEWHGTNASTATATRSSARTSSTTAATRRWAARGRTSTSPRSAARRSGRTRPRATRRPRPTSGGTSTTPTARRPARDRPRGRRAAGGDAAGAGRHEHRPAGRARVAEPARATPAGARDVSDTRALHIERTFQAPAEAVFDAWTSEEVIRRWWQAEVGWETSEAEVDLRVGGAVRVVMRDPANDVDHGGGGYYTEIEPPRRLAFTWIWDGDTRRTLIELDFEETDGVTTVSFTHSGLWDEAAVRDHEGGWGRILDRLARTLEAAGPDA